MSRHFQRANSSSRFFFLARVERAATIRLLHHLNEIARRKLHLELGFGSLYDYCVRRLQYSGSSACRRFQAARCIREYPDVLALLETGELDLGTIYLIEPVLTVENRDEVPARVLLGEYLERHGPQARQRRREAKKAAAARSATEEDRGQCTYVAPNGTRCASRHALQIDHMRSFAAGGGNDACNLRLFCAAHNRLAAEQALGKHVMERYWRRE